MKVLCLTLLLFSCVFGQFKWSDDFTQDLASNPLLDPNYNVNMGWDGASSYVPSIDPITANHALQNIYGMWRFDSLVGSTAIDSSSVFPTNLTVYGVTLGPGKFGKAAVFTGVEKINATTSPLTNQMAHGYGFTVAMWFKGGNTTIPSATVTLFEVQYGNIEIELSKKGYQCVTRQTGGTFYNTAASFGPSDPTGSTYGTEWTHVACVIDPATSNVTLYINGQASATAAFNFTGGLYFPDHSAMGIGNHPGGTGPSVFGSIDEVIFYASALSPTAVNYLATATSEITYLPPPSFRSKLLQYTATSAYWDIQASWTFGRSGGNESAIVVEVSTSRGVVWCPLKNGASLGMNEPCYLPAKNLVYRVSFVYQVDLDSLTFTVVNNEPQRNWGTNVRLGINRGNVNYYAPSWMFVDAQKSASPPDPMSFTFDANYYPLDSNYTAKHMYTYLTYTTAKYGPQNMNYTVFADGEGIIDCENSKDASGNFPGGVNRYLLNVPGDLPHSCYMPRQISIFSTNPNNHIRNISIVMHGFENNYTTEPFHPRFMELFQGTSCQRFMDTGKTNGNNIVQWSDRTLTTHISQDMKINSPMIQVQSITDASGVPSAFSGDWKVLVTTTTPHPFATGQSVTFWLTDVEIDWTISGAAQTPIHFNASTFVVEVLSSTTFYAPYGTSKFQPKSAGINTVSVSVSKLGSVYAVVSSGVAYEYMIQLATTMNTDGWFCIPAYANDEYVRNMAQMIYDKLPKNLRAVIEYGNEMWNAGFTQAVITQRMGTAYYSDSQGYIATRIAQIFGIFSDVFGDEFHCRIVKLVPGFNAGYTWADGLLTKLNTTQYNPRGIKFDAISVAPYFGGGIAGTIGDNKAQNTTSIDEVVDMARDALYTSILPEVKSNAAIARKWNVTLIAYEGGPGLAAPVWYTSPAYINLTNILTGANSHPMMKDLVKQMFYMWYSNGGDLFTYFDDVGTWGIYGSWGILQNLGDDITQSPKYQAFKEILDLAQTMPPDPHRCTVPGPTSTSHATSTTASSYPYASATTTTSYASAATTTTSASYPSATTTAATTASYPSTAAAATSAYPSSTATPAPISSSPPLLSSYLFIILCVSTLVVLLI